MSGPKHFYNALPAFIVGAIEGLIVILAIFCFLLARGVDAGLIYIYTGIAVVFIAGLLAVGAYYTRKEEMDNSGGESKILKIYQSLDIDDHLKKAMVDDTLQENKVWEKEWQEGGNATSSLMPKQYALSVFWGFLTGGIIILINNYLVELPNYAALLIPFLLLAILGFYKYKLSNQKPVNGMLLISLSGMAAAIGAWYAGGLF
ncbi:VIT1/CCC1 transporter family protein [Niabella hibiscisoli]|uniref:VIT1/CCC1 transporter family protein n=1 Tax=Niabella hibiscisoli TaxID=1825928 RepID=UPI001F1117FA|nr:VIT1/CCC1 transporter family protein [Niabella hibiscisoli]MCH5720709.1 VIT1/CCC1 transporter family protein [Niabella hibiscisoli]